MSEYNLIKGPKEPIDDEDNKEIPYVFPSFIPTPGGDKIENRPEREEYPAYKEPIQTDRPLEMGETGVKEF